MNSMEAFFDEMAAEWDNDPENYDKREKITAMISISENSVIADIGCGKGVMFEHLLKTSPKQIIAMDISAQMLRLAKELFKDDRIQYIHDDFLTAILPPLDVVVMFNAYPHFLDKEALAKKLSEVLKDNGIFIIAHSMNRETLNSLHSGEAVSKVSTCLEAAGMEADKFKKFFDTELLVDDDEMYFIKLKRKG